ncbi:LemA family protein [Marinilongibacter aquaticus]|uniref:LemA family protein n=1 Tax=Marinilongibacter aquaticus TaxID=2975157 RepID=UPI0021BD1189|nr:LemA family protein [Marinilongibacter aquaticus]UBM60447.1 LemA family protein [Marinilongibacter aquaticus]
MKKLGTLVIVGLVILFGLYGCNSYNGLVQKDNKVDELWSNVQTQYQRRADLINNLVKTVQGAADFEKSTLTQVIDARAKATSMQLSASDLTEENLAKFQAAQDQLSGALSRLLVSVERYPDLKANQNFLELQAQIEGTENRISVARNDFNAGVSDYNLSVRTFPMNLMAGIFGFERRAFFKAAESAQDAPDVNFDFK